MVDAQSEKDAGVRAKIGKAPTAFFSLKEAWSSEETRRYTKLRIFNSNVKLVLLYAVGNAQRRGAADATSNLEKCGWQRIPAK